MSRAESLLGNLKQARGWLSRAGAATTRRHAVALRNAPPARPTLLSRLPPQLLSVSFGVRGTRNAASWAVAGGLAYWLIYLPEQRRRQEIEARP
jgi:hypothetical protein